jgi:hypothetical protein
MSHNLYDIWTKLWLMIQKAKDKNSYYILAWYAIMIIFQDEM